MLRWYYSATERTHVSTDSEIMFLIYEGEHFEVEFYFDENGEMQGREEFQELTENENSIYYEISRFRMKRVENINNKKLPTIYYKGGLVDYDWEVISYSYTI